MPEVSIIVALNLVAQTTVFPLAQCFVAKEFGKDSLAWI